MSPYFRAVRSIVSFLDLRLASFRNLGVRPSAFLVALLSIFCIVFSCESVKIPRCVA